MRQGNTKGLGDKTKTFAFTVISPEHPLNYSSSIFASLISSAIFIGWKTFQKCSSTIISTDFPDCSKKDFSGKKKVTGKT